MEANGGKLELARQRKHGGHRMDRDEAPGSDSNGCSWVRGYVDSAMFVATLSSTAFLSRANAREDGRGGGEGVDMMK